MFFYRNQPFLLFSLWVLLVSFSLSAQTSPTVTLTDTDTDNLLSASDTVTITALFSEAMVATPTISISGVSSITNIAMLRSAGVFHQIGSTISGRVEDDNLRIAGLSEDGSTIAGYYDEGLEDLNGDGNNNLVLKVFRYKVTSNSWEQIGGDFISYSKFDMDKNLSMSSDGNILAVGSSTSNSDGDSNAGVVSVYSYDSNTNSWNQLGTSFEGDGVTTFLNKVSLSSDGTRLAIGQDRYSSIGKSQNGYLRILDYTPTGTTSWTEIGLIVDRPNAYTLGQRVEMSGDGNTVAALEGTSSGGTKNIRIYRYTPTGVTSWTVIGNLNTRYLQSNYYGTGISLTSDGNKIAIGEPDGRLANSQPGIVRIYKYDTGTSWDLEQSFSGEIGTSDSYGGGVDISSDGNKLVISSMEKDNNKGIVEYYEYTASGTSSWTQYGETLLGSVTGEKFGRDVKISADGSRFAVGSTNTNAETDGSGTFDSEGQIKVYNLGDQYKYTWDISRCFGCRCGRILRICNI